MPAHMVVFVTTGSIEEGQNIAQTLVKEHLAACVNILSRVHSIYRWEGQIQNDQETLLIVKTTAELSERLSLRVQQLHSYEVPEIIAVPVVAGAQEYLDWIDAQTCAQTDASSTTAEPG